MCDIQASYLIDCMALTQHSVTWSLQVQAAMNEVPVRRQSAINVNRGWWRQMLLIFDHSHPS